MTVAGSISAALIRFGRTMTLRRQSGVAPSVTNTDVSVYGVTEEYLPQELVNGIMQGDVRVKFSNAEIAAASWPAPPVKNDRMIIDGRVRTIIAVEPKYLSTDILVYYCQVRG